MPYHRGGHPGAVAVSYSTSTMAPLSPSRRYSGSTGSSSGGTSSASGGSTSNYGSYLSSSSSGSDRSGSYYRRTYFSPARSVSSYGESVSTVGSSSSAVSGRFGSSSSASSTASSSSSTGSRERNGLGGATSSPSPTTAAEIYAKYSPANYVPNIYSSSKTGNGHWRPSSSSVLAELHGGDEYDSCRERRERSYSSDTSSINNSSSSGIVNGSALVSPGLAERWSTRRESKRRNAPVQSVRFASSVTLHDGPARHDSATAPTEVTPIAEARNVLDEVVVDRRALTSQPVSSSSATVVENSAVDEPDPTNDTRDDDNNNTARTVENGNGNEPGERRTDANETDRDDELVLTRDNRDFGDEPVGVNGRVSVGRVSLTRSAIGIGDRDDRHCRPIGFSRRFDDESVKSVSSSSLSSGTASSADGSPISRPERAVPVRGELGEAPGDHGRFGATDGADNRSRDKLVGGRSSSTISAETRDDRRADRDRAACARTKITTNNDNTELLTNNNGHDREADVLVVVETARSAVGDEATRTSSTTARRSLLWTSSNDFETRTNERNDLDRPDGDEVDGEAGTSGLEEVADDSGEDEERNANGSSSGLRNGVVGRPGGNRGDDPGKPSTSRRTGYGWNDPGADDIANNTAAASSSSSSSSSAGHSAPAAVHQNIYRGINEQIDESSNSRPPRNRLQSRRDERYGLNGLRNIGNTCFMNSVIQCLSNTRPLLEYLLNEQHLQDINTTTSSMKGALIKAFGQVIHELWEMSGDHVVNTTALKSQIQRFAPRFMGYSQQDAQEFLRYLLEGLHEDVNRVTVKPQPILTDIPDHYSDSHKAAESWKRYLRSEDSTIVDVFVGQLRSSLHCTSCDHVSVTLDPFWDLSLPIPVRSGTVKLNQCLEHFTKVETLDGDEKPTCSKCQMRRKCTKSFSIQKFPKILVIHLKRFSPTERFRGKLSVLVDFPLTGLDLSAFAAPGVQGCTYNLYGVANHSGTTYSGHYTAYCKHPYSGDWHEYNDNRVSTVPARSVVSSEAYVLFYEQQPPSSHL